MLPRKIPCEEYKLIFVYIPYIILKKISNEYFYFKNVKSEI